MARALLGYVGPSSEQQLVLEIARLRHRVAELEAEVTELRSQQHHALDIELHRMAADAAAAPALA